MNGLQNLIPKISNIKGSYRSNIVAFILSVISIAGKLTDELSFIQASPILGMAVYLFLLPDIKFRKDEEGTYILDNYSNNISTKSGSLPEVSTSGDYADSPDGYDPYS